MHTTDSTVSQGSPLLAAPHRTLFFAAPTMVKRLVEHPSIGRANLGRLKSVVYGGGPMYVEDAKAAFAALGPRLAQIYGQGESPMTITAMGRELVADAIARGYITDRGYEEFPHALGHQVGRHAHDGAELLCPVWERYGNLPYLAIEENQVYTLEPRITVAGYGVVTMEEIIVVRPGGGEFLSHPQRELYLAR